MDTKQTIHGARVRHLREAMGLKQAEVAARLAEAGAGVNQAFLSQVERGEKSVSLETLVAMAQLFEVSADYLLGLVDDPGSRMERDEAATLYEDDPVQRASLQQIFSSVERLPDDLRRQFYDALHLIFLGVMQKRKERSR